MYGAASGSRIVALDGLVISVWLASGRREFYRVAFNMAVPALSIWFAGTLYYSLAGLQHPSALTASTHTAPPLLPLIAFTLCHFLINSWLIAFAVAFETGRRSF